MIDHHNGYELKILRAKEHFEALNGQVAEFLKGYPYRPVIEFDPDAGDRDARKRIIRMRIVDDPPPRLSVLIGDCLHNLRSALDHLAWQLASRHSKTPPDFTEFPIFLDRHRYFRLRSDGSPFPGRGLAKVSGIAPNVQARIECLQPYNRTDGPPSFHPLWLLQALSNEDKHRILQVVGAVLESADFAYIGAPDISLAAKEFTFGPFEDGAIVARLQSGPRNIPTHDANVKFELETTLNVAFGNQGPAWGMPIGQTIATIANFVSQVVVPDLTPFL